MRAISDERDYQDHEVAGERADMFELNMGSALLAIQYNLRKAFEAWYTDNPDAAYQDTLEYLRKVAALIVKQGETYGMPRREWPGSVENMKVKSDAGMSERVCPSSLHSQLSEEEMEKEASDVYLANQLKEELRKAIESEGVKDAEYHVEFDGKDKILVNIVLPPVTPESVQVELSEVQLNMRTGSFMYQNKIPWINIGSEETREYTLSNGCLVVIDSPLYFYQEGNVHKIYTRDHQCYHIDLDTATKIQWEARANVE